MKITDVHCHIFPHKIAEKAAGAIGDFYGVKMFEVATVENLAAAHEAAGINRCVVSNSATTTHQVHSINTFIGESIAHNPNYIGFGSIIPGMDGWQEELDHLQAMGLRGLKIHPDFQKIPIDVPAGFEMYREIARRGLPVLFHMGDYRYDFSSSQRLLNLLRQAPDLRVIAAHFGGWSVWETAMDTTMPENVVYDTSSTTPMTNRDLVLRMIDFFGPDRLLFGSDFPMWQPKAMVDQILDLGLDQSSLETIFYRNFEKLFGPEGSE